MNQFHMITIIGRSPDKWTIPWAHTELNLSYNVILTTEEVGLFFSFPKSSAQEVVIFIFELAEFANF